MVARLLLVLSLAAAGLLTACGPDDPCARHPDGRFDLARMQIGGPDHPPVDSGRACATCHPLTSIHRANCTGLSWVDVAEVRTIVASDGPGSCSRCHGTWRPSR